MNGCLEQVALTAEADRLQKAIFERKMAITSLKTDREKISALKGLFPLHFTAMTHSQGEGPLTFCFRLAFMDWVDFVSRHIKNDDIAIKDAEIDQFREVLAQLFILCGAYKAIAYQLATAEPTQAEIEEKFGFGELIKAVDELNDPQCAEYLQHLRDQGPIYPKLEELIAECYEIAQHQG